MVPWNGITLYGAIDVGGGYATARSALGPSYPNGISDNIAKYSRGPGWTLVPNGLSQSNIGIKIKEPIGAGWNVIGDINAGFDPYTLRFANGPQSLVDNNLRTLGNQSSNADSSRTYGIDNSRAYLGVSNPTYGTLTFGRQNVFTNDASTTYDPFGGAYAYSLIGTSGSSWSGNGYTELARSNLSAKYLYNNNGLRAGAMLQLGGYGQYNGAKNFGQVDLGADFYGFSFDAIFTRAIDAVNLSSYSGGAIPAFGTPSTLKATMANVSAGALAAKYKWNSLTLYGGYENAQLTNPSGAYGATATGNAAALMSVDAQQVVVQKFGFPNTKVLQLAYIGAKYAITPEIDIAAGYYHQWQNNYAYKPGQAGYTAGATGTGSCAANVTPAIAGASPQGSQNSTCAGTQDVISAMIDYRPVKRVDLYGGFMFSQVSGGLASGFIKSVDFMPTVGLKVAF